MDRIELICREFCGCSKIIKVDGEKLRDDGKRIGDNIYKSSDIDFLLGVHRWLGLV